jgi:hypothetical protein
VTEPWEAPEGWEPPGTADEVHDFADHTISFLRRVAGGEIVLYYDLDGQPTDLATYMALWGVGGGRGRILGDDVVGNVTVRTVWWGIAHNAPFIGPEGPQIIGTALLIQQPPQAHKAVRVLADVELYSNQADARLGHARWVERVRAGDIPAEGSE